MDLREQLGNIDIYLFDQLLKERLVPGMRLLDAGCGGGRNLVWFLRNGYEVCGVDENPEAVAAVRRLAAALAPHLPPESSQMADVTDLPFPDARFDAVLSSAVLHWRHLARSAQDHAGGGPAGDDDVGAGQGAVIPLHTRGQPRGRPLHGNLDPLLP